MDISQLPTFTVLDNPLVYQELSLLRDKNTSSDSFRRSCKKLTQYLLYESLRDASVGSLSVETPLETVDVPVLRDAAPVFVGIWRAGQIMVDAALDVLPNASARHLGIYRDEETYQPQFYYKNLPDSLSGKKVFVFDPMLATGGSAVYALTVLKEAGVRSEDIQLLHLIGCPEGVSAIHDFDDQVRVSLAAVDEKLDENSYIVPGLGDAGDRINGTL